MVRTTAVLHSACEVPQRLTTDLAHALMQEHLAHLTAICPARQAALAHLVTHGRYVPDPTPTGLSTPVDQA
jgi:hypothetical protein